MSEISQILETAMLLCFGLSWPLSLIRNIKAKTARSMSLPFICLIIIGYICGITAKLISGHFAVYVLVVYIFNLVVVSANLVVYFINSAYDKKAGLTKK